MRKKMGAGSHTEKVGLWVGKGPQQGRAPAGCAIWKEGSEACARVGTAGRGSKRIGETLRE